ncbi:hypothetical protein [Caldimonas mangrovi]|uniref:hypothetical protein n=1 Tax=Caldimonas mangrovi TaxID=2944811 RepID=UPI002043880E|nr:hypothetical protein [Caldimonas mangrovi]
MNCPVCQSPRTVEGRVISDGSEDGRAEKFFPRGLKLFKLRRAVRLSGGHAFRACCQCGHVWNQLDPKALRALIEASGNDALKDHVRGDHPLAGAS